MTKYNLFLTKYSYGCQKKEFDGDFIFLEVVQYGFCILAIQSFSAYYIFKEHFSIVCMHIFKQIAKIKNISFATIYQSPFDKAVKAGFIMSCLMYNCE
jgi:hypothetical protein